MTEARRFALIGHPVAHSISPELHHAAYRALGASHRYEKIDCPDEAAVRREVEALRSGAIAGINVTVPWKRLALALADRRDDLAAQIGAANVLVRGPDGAIAAYNTDALALVEELGGRAAPPRAVAIIGSGGAARAAVAASRSLGAGRIAVIGRRWSPGSPRDTWANAADFSALGAIVMPWPALEPRSDWEAHVAASDIVVQATSAGMKGADPGEPVAEIVQWSQLVSGALAYDVVYNPPLTPFLAAARARGIESRGGLGMLVGQAALSIELWLGTAAPRAAMAEAAERALSLKSRE